MKVDECIIMQAFDFFLFFEGETIGIYKQLKEKKKRDWFFIIVSDLDIIN